jgi:hypothetical protein
VRLFSLITFFILSLSCFSQKESRKAPDWINGSAQGYLIVSATGGSIQQAKDKAFSKVRENVVLSVAVQVKYASEGTVSEKVHNQTREINEEFVSKVNLHSAELGFVNGISESKIVDFYWARTSKRKQPLEYVYFIKYPFSDKDLATLLSDYDREVRKRKAELEALKKEVVLLSTQDSLSTLLQKIKYFRSQTGFYDDRVLSQLEFELNDFVKTSKFEIQRNELGYFELHMFRNGKPFSTTIESLSSELKDLRWERDNKSYKCYYDYSYMSYSDKVNMDVSYNLMGKVCKRNMSIDLGSVYPKFNLLKLSARQAENGLGAFAQISALNQVGFIVESVELTVKSKSFIFQNSIPDALLKYGNNELSLRSNDNALDFFAALDAAYSLADVSIRYKIPNTKFEHSINLYQVKILL